MRNTIKILILSIFTLIILSLLTCVNAATASVSANKTNVTVGENVTITVNVNAASWSISVGGAVSGRMTGYNEDGVNQNASKQFTLNTSTAGTYTVSISGDVTDQSSDYSTPVSGSVTVIVNAPVVPPEQPPTNNNGNQSSGGNTTTKPNNNNNTTTKPKENKSSNSRLGSLQIAEGAITPEFESKTREYTINIPNEITALNIEAVAEDSKATVRITGNEELQVGENEISVVVTAEDGSKTTYIIKAIRADEELGLQSLSVFYINENGEKTPLDLEPLLVAGVYEYKLKDISYKIDKLLVEAIANKEIATIEIKGNENLKEGKNEIQIILTIKSEVEEEIEQEGQENLLEQKIYTIIVNKEMAPVPPAPLTTTQKIKNWFNGAGTWISENLMKIQAVALLVSATALAGLTVYFVYDYKNYKKLLEKLAEINKTNLMEKANFALGTENVEKAEVEKTKTEEVKTENEETTKISEKTSKSELLEEFVKTSEMPEEGRTKFGKGKRFRQ